MESASHETYKRLSQLGKGTYGSAFLVWGENNPDYSVIKQIDMEELDAEGRKAAL